MDLQKNEDVPCDSLTLGPGSVYIGNLCAVSHQIVHDEEKHGRAEHLWANGDTLKVMIMLRTSLFSKCRSRRMNGVPTPKVVYDRCNAVVAKHLRDSKLLLPSYPECLATMKLLSLG